MSVVDLANGTEQLPATDALLISGETIKVVVRPSGTEPKLKCYLEARSLGRVTGDLDAARASTRGDAYRDQVGDVGGPGSYDNGHGIGALTLHL